jgi:hypothetical protein
LYEHTVNYLDQNFGFTFPLNKSAQMALCLRANIYDNEYIVRDVLIRIKPPAVGQMRSPHGVTFFEKKGNQKSFVSLAVWHRGSWPLPLLVNYLACRWRKRYAGTTEYSGTTEPMRRASPHQSVASLTCFSRPTMPNNLRNEVQRYLRRLLSRFNRPFSASSSASR